MPRSIALALFILGAGAGFSADPEVKIGDKIANLRFKDTHYLIAFAERFRREEGIRFRLR